MTNHVKRFISVENDICKQVIIQLLPHNFKTGLIGLEVLARHEAWLSHICPRPVHS